MADPEVTTKLAYADSFTDIAPINTPDKTVFVTSASAVSVNRAPFSNVKTEPVLKYAPNGFTLMEVAPSTAAPVATIFPLGALLSASIPM